MQTEPLLDILNARLFLGKATESKAAARRQGTYDNNLGLNGNKSEHAGTLGCIAELSFVRV